MSKIEPDKSLCTVPNYEFKQIRVKSESNCLNA